MTDLAEQAASIYLANQSKDPNLSVEIEDSDPWYKIW
jgi:hypothetical protein